MRGVEYNILSEEDGGHKVFMKTVEGGTVYLGLFDSHNEAVVFVRGHRDQHRPDEFEGVSIKKTWGGRGLGAVTHEESS